MAPAAKRRKLAGPATEEITFDFDARSDYLTGFHKRKLQRIKHAQEEAAKKERIDRIEDRKRMREERKADLERHVETVNALLQKANEEIVKTEDNEENGSSSTDGEEWGGLDPPPEVDREDEYIDEGKYTTVTVEAIDISKDGLHNVEDRGQLIRSEVAEIRKDQNGNSKAPVKSVSEKDAKGRRIWTKEKPDKAKKKKKKFRYENKLERKATRIKERSGNKAKARARRE